MSDFFDFNIQFKQSTKVLLLEALPTWSTLLASFAQPVEQILVIADVRFKKNEVWRRSFAKANSIYWVKPGESLKDVESFAKHVLRIQKALPEISRNRFGVVAVGGGSVGDFSGFFASVFLRGVPWVVLPTTWLSAIDSAHGGKTALNAGGMKNQIGSINLPQAVIIIKDFLQLNMHDRMSEAFGELAKMALLAGGNFWTHVRELKELSFTSFWRLLPEAIQAKYLIVEKDPFDIRNHRIILNLGHTLGHALETTSGVPHGKAVYHGLLFAVRWSQHRGYLSAEGETEVLTTLEGLADNVAEEKAKYARSLRANAIAKVFRRDKKRSKVDTLDFVFLQEVGRPLVKTVNISALITELKRQGWLMR